MSSVEDTMGLIVSATCSKFVRSITYFFFNFQDATANDIPNDTFEVKGYPTLYFKSASGKITQYDEDRDKESIIAFIEKNRDKIEKQEATKDEL